MANWNKPVLADPYSDFLDSLTQKDTDSATLFLVDPTNPPVGVIRYNRSLNLFQEWNGTTWVNKVIAQAGGGTGAGSMPTLGTMATQNANNVAITGGNMSNMSSVGSNADVTAARDINAARNMSCVNSYASTNYNTPGTVTAGGAISGANIIANPGGYVATSGAAGHHYVRGLLVTGNADLILTNANGKIVNLTSTYFNQLQGHEITNLNGSAIDRGQVWVSFLGTGATGAGTKVLMDNGVWTDKNLVGGGMVEIVHNNSSFGTGETTKPVVIAWTGAQPASAKKVSIQINGGNSGARSVVTGTNTFNLVIPSAAPGTLVEWTAFHHITQY